MKTLIVWIGALIFGALGGILGQRFSTHSSAPIDLTSLTRAPSFELVDRTGRTVSIWTTDQWGRPFLGMSDAKWEGRIVIGPIMGPEYVGRQPSEWGPWGIAVTAPGRDAYAVLGTTVPLDTKKPTGFISLQNEHKTWRQDAEGRAAN